MGKQETFTEETIADGQTVDVLVTSTGAPLSDHFQLLSAISDGGYAA